MRTKILVIEDNEPNLYLLTFILERAGYEVTSARTGPEGLARALETRPDLVLTDLQLPGLDGYELARRLRGDPAMRQVPIVAVTAHAMEGDREKALDCGCDGYIEKPIIPTRFCQQIEGFLPRRRAAWGGQRRVASSRSAGSPSHAV